MIYECDPGPGYVISSHGCWLPGVYDTERAARFAFRRSDSVLQALADQANAQGRMITWDDVKAAAP